MESGEFGESVKFGENGEFEGFDEGNALGILGPVESGEFGESSEFGENLPKGLTKANELAQRARGKRRIWQKWRIWRNFVTQ